MPPTKHAPPPPPRHSPRLPPRFPFPLATCSPETKSTNVFAPVLRDSPNLSPASTCTTSSDQQVSPPASSIRKQHLTDASTPRLASPLSIPSPTPSPIPSPVPSKHIDLSTIPSPRLQDHPRIATPSPFPATSSSSGFRTVAQLSPRVSRLLAAILVPGINVERKHLRHPSARISRTRTPDESPAVYSTEEGAGVDMVEVQPPDAKPDAAPRIQRAARPGVVRSVSAPVPQSSTAAHLEKKLARLGRLLEEANAELVQLREENAALRVLVDAAGAEGAAGLCGVSMQRSGSGGVLGVIHEEEADEDAGLDEVGGMTDAAVQTEVPEESLTALLGAVAFQERPHTTAPPAPPLPTTVIIPPTLIGHVQSTTTPYWPDILSLIIRPSKSSATNPAGIELALSPGVPVPTQRQWNAVATILVLPTSQPPPKLEDAEVWPDKAPIIPRRPGGLPSPTASSSLDGRPRSPGCSIPPTGWDSISSVQASSVHVGSSVVAATVGTSPSPGSAGSGPSNHPQIGLARALMGWPDPSGLYGATTGSTARLRNPPPSGFMAGSSPPVRPLQSRLRASAAPRLDTSADAHRVFPLPPTAMIPSVSLPTTSSKASLPESQSSTSTSSNTDALPARPNVRQRILEVEERTVAPPPIPPRPTMVQPIRFADSSSTTSSVSEPHAAGEKRTRRAVARRGLAGGVSVIRVPARSAAREGEQGVEGWMMRGMEGREWRLRP